MIQKYFSFTTEYIYTTLDNYYSYSIFGFLRFLNMSYQELTKILDGDILERLCVVPRLLTITYYNSFRWKTYFETDSQQYHLYQRLYWSKNKEENLLRLRPNFKLSFPIINTSNILKDLIFTSTNNGRNVIYTHATHYYYSMPETVEHRNIRCKTINTDEGETIIDVVNDDAILVSI